MSASSCVKTGFLRMAGVIEIPRRPFLLFGKFGNKSCYIGGSMLPQKRGCMLRDVSTPP